MVKYSVVKIHVLHGKGQALGHMLFLNNCALEQLQFLRSSTHYNIRKKLLMCNNQIEQRLGILQGSKELSVSSIHQTVHQRLHIIIQQRDILGRFIRHVNLFADRHYWESGVSVKRSNTTKCDS